MSHKHREQPVVRAYANQDAIDLVSDDDWDEYETRLLQSSSSGTAPSSRERTARSPSKSSQHKRKREEAATPVPTDSDEHATKRPRRPRRSDESKSGKSGKPSETTVGSRTNPADMAAPQDLIGIDVGDSCYSINSVVDQARVGPSDRSSFSIKPTEIHVSATLSRSSGGTSNNKKLSTLGVGASPDETGVSDTAKPLTAQTLLPKPLAAKTTRDDEGDTPPAKPKGKPVGGPKLGRPEKKKPKKQLEAEKKALDLREKKMTRREFIQYLYEEKLREELENASPKGLVLEDKVIWYAEPGSAKASDSFDRRRYEMVRVPCCCLAPTLIPLPARPPWGHRRA